MSARDLAATLVLLGLVACHTPMSGTSAPAQQEAAPTRAEPRASNMARFRLPRRIAGGNLHTCRITSQAGVECWGSNSDGQLGDGTGRPSRIPVHVVGVEGAIALAGGDRHTCALLRTGELRCWGSNDSGQIGDGGPDLAETPRPVQALTRVSAVAASSDRTCALQDNVVWCWGDRVPVPRMTFFGGNRVDELCTGTKYTCTRTGGEVDCWVGDSTSPVKIPSVSNATALTCNNAHGCVLHGEEAACWQVDEWVDSDEQPQLTMVGGASGLAHAVDITAGRQHACVLLIDGSVHCWGDNRMGQLGGYKQSNNAVKVTDLPPVSAIGGASSHTCAQRHDDRIACWGGNFGGASGWGDEELSLVPERIRGVSGVRHLAAVDELTCYRQEDEAFCWGQAPPLGFDTSELTGPTPIAELRNFVGLVKLDRRIAAWTEQQEMSIVHRVGPPGPRLDGVVQLATTILGQYILRADGSVDEYDGDRVTPIKPWPQLSSSLRGGKGVVKAIQPFGYLGACALHRSGEIVCSSEQGAPLISVSLAGPGGGFQQLKATAMAVNSTAGCALLSDESVACWKNQYYTDRLVATRIPKLGAVREIVAGRGHFCVRTRHGEVACWGVNRSAQLGNGTTRASDTPVRASGLPAVQALAAGESHTCGLTTGGEVFCWGDHHGNGKLIQAAKNRWSDTPVLVGDSSP